MTSRDAAGTIRFPTMRKIPLNRRTPRKPPLRLQFDRTKNRVFELRRGGGTVPKPPPGWKFVKDRLVREQ